MIRTGIGLATSAAIDTAQKEMFPEKAKIQVNFGNQVLRYTDYSKIEFVNIDNPEIGLLRFFNQLSEISFYFSGNSSYDNNKLKKKMLLIYNKINECMRNSIIHAVNPVENCFVTSKSKDNFEDIRKYKALMDEGIISKEEFDVKKKELFGL